VSTLQTNDLVFNGTPRDYKQTHPADGMLCLLLALMDELMGLKEGEARNITMGVGTLQAMAEAVEEYETWRFPTVS
jgi:hypothetical protein